LGRLATHRFHLIEAGRYTSALSLDSTMKPDWRLLNYLHNAGRDEAEKWLSLHRASVGRRSSVGLRAQFLKGTDGQDDVLPPEEITAPAEQKRAL
jgi:NTE family protein